MTTKRKVALVAAAVLFGLMVLLAAALGGPAATPMRWEEAVLQGEGPDKLAVISVEGQIVQGGPGSPSVDAAAADDIVSQLRQAEEDAAVKGVILRLNTPGGSVVASDEIYRQVLDLREAGKPVVASMAEVAASGGYFVAAGADRVVANQATITGSIGVIMVLVNLEEAAGKLGVRPVIIKAGELKDIGSPFAELTEQERGILQELIDQAYDRFVEVVAEGRDLDRADVVEVADGRPLSGLQAEELGLVDALGGFDTAVEEAERLAELDGSLVVAYRRPFSFGDLFGRGWPGFRGPVGEVEESLGVTGPMLKYLYIR